MKKVTCMMIAMVCMVMGLTSANAEEPIMEGYYSDAMKCIEYWIQQNGNEVYLNNRLENDYYKGYAVVNVNEFERHYGIEWSMKTFVELNKEEYGNCEIIISKVGYYEQYPVYLMYAKANEGSIGYTYQDGISMEIYEGEVYFMLVRD